MQAAAIDELKARLKAGGEAHDEASRIRLHRALSWLKRAAAEEDDPDARSIFQWIAFNAAYARELDHDTRERQRLHAFFEQIEALDHEGRLSGLLFDQFTGPLRTLIGNKYVFQPFWTALRNHDSSNAWETAFHASRKKALASVLNGETVMVLAITFDRLYILRNQLVHGGATWASRVNREQVGDGARIMGAIVPLIIELMIDHPDTDFGDILYPVV